MSALSNMLSYAFLFSLQTTVKLHNSNQVVQVKKLLYLRQIVYELFFRKIYYIFLKSS